MSTIPRDHPRYFSLVIREKITEAMKKGLVHETGLIAHGRGEAYDYLIGEKTTEAADKAAEAAAAMLLLAEKPVISLNGNSVALASKECVELAKNIQAKIEINLFHRTVQRVKLLVKEMEKQGAEDVLGLNADKYIPGLKHDRALCEKNGIFSSDVILVPLEDGDRCQALKKMGKKVITIDLNPVSRTAKNADITIVDNIIRAVPNLNKWVKIMHGRDKKSLKEKVASWDNHKMLNEVLYSISKNLKSQF